MSSIADDQAGLMMTAQRMQRVLDDNADEMAFLRARAEEDAKRNAALEAENAQLKANIADMQVVARGSSDRADARVVELQIKCDAATAEAAELQKNRSTSAVSSLRRVAFAISAAEKPRPLCRVRGAISIKYI